MTLDRLICRGRLTLCPFEPRIHLRPFLEMVRAQPWAVDDSWGAEPASYVLSKLVRDEALIMAGYKAGRFFGAIDLDGIFPDRTAWISGYGLSGEPWAARRFFDMALGWAFRRFRLVKIQAHYCSLNRGVEMVLKACGFRPEGELTLSRWYQGRAYSSRIAGLAREDYDHGR